MLPGDMKSQTQQQWFDYIKQDWIFIREPRFMSFEDGQRLVSQSEVAQAAYLKGVKLGMTPYLSVLMVLANGNK